MELTVIAYPKINIGLYIGSKQENGYHNLISIFQKVDNFFDTIKIHLEDADYSEVTVSMKNVPLELNTMYIAANLWLEKTGKKAKINIKIDKQIPTRAGLGGGSSDAAAVLCALEKTNLHPLSMSQLISLASQVGSDVPFFVMDIQAAVVEGRGEKITPIEARELKFDLYDTGFEKLSTGQAYSKLDELENCRELPTAKELIKMYYSPVEQWNFKNDFLLIYPQLPAGTMLSGSGSWAWKVLR